jgi:hypothetical protein
MSTAAYPLSFHYSNNTKWSLQTTAVDTLS